MYTYVYIRSNAHIFSGELVGFNMCKNVFILLHGMCFKLLSRYLFMFVCVCVWSLALFNFC